MRSGPRWAWLPVLPMVMVIVLAMGCGTSPAGGTGAIEGKVTIGPLTPVERPGEKPPVPPEVYAARKILVYDASRSQVVRQVDIGADGRYRVELPEGNYVVDLKKNGIDRSPDVPRTVEVRTGQTITLNIDIDTGIR